MEADLVTRLRAALAAVLGGDAGGVKAVSWFDRQRADSLPALLLTKVSPGRDWSHDGPDQLDRPRVQFDCFAASETAVLALALALRAEMETAADIGTTRFHPAQLDGENWIAEGQQDGGQALFRIQTDYLFHHEEI